MSDRFKNILLALLFTIVLGTVLIVGYHMVSDDSGAKRILQLLGGSMPSGIVQLITFFLCFFGLLEIASKNKGISREYKGIRIGLLPEKEQYVLSPDEVNEIKLAIIEQENTEKFLVTDMIKKACTKYRAEKSVSQVQELVEAQARMNLNRSESEQSLIRYVAWAIPSVGFIGTIIGISGALGLANDTTPEGIERITSTLMVAFDTTLISLFLSLILMYFIHSYQEKSEKLHVDVEDYITDNLVNRINPE